MKKIVELTKEVAKNGSVYCMIDIIMIDKRLATANNPNPDLLDLEMCVQSRGLDREVLGQSEKILKFFNQPNLVGKKRMMITI